MTERKIPPEAFPMTPEIKAKLENKWSTLRGSLCICPYSKDQLMAGAEAGYALGLKAEMERVVAIIDRGLVGIRLYISSGYGSDISKSKDAYLAENLEELKEEILNPTGDV